MKTDLYLTWHWLTFNTTHIVSLSAYDYSVTNCPGSDHANADLLSPCQCRSTQPTTSTRSTCSGTTTCMVTLYLLMDTMEELQLQRLASVIGLHVTGPILQYYRRCRMVGKVPQMMNCERGGKLTSVSMMDVFCLGIESLSQPEGHLGMSRMEDLARSFCLHGGHTLTRTWKSE